MNTLRIVLIVVGVIFIIGIVLFQNRTLVNKNYSAIKTRLTGFLDSILKKIQPNILLLKKRVKNSFTSNNDSDERTRYLHPELSSEQLDGMGNMIATKPVQSQNNKAEPVLNEYSDTVKSRALQNTERAQTGSTPVNTELLITLTVLPKQGEVFNGDDILTASKLAGLQLGEYNIYHRYALVNEKVLMTPVCSLLNLFEPGYFDPSNMDSFTTEGLSLFMQLPGPVDGREAFKILMDVSEKLSENLNATICDETRSVLTTQTISHIKEKVENFRFKLKMDSLKSH